MVDPTGGPGSARVRRTARRLAVGLSIGIYSLAAPFGCLIVAALNGVWSGDELTRVRRMQRITAGAYRLMHDWLRILRLVDFDHRIALEGLPSGPCVVVANHPTLVDITAISAVLGGGFTIVKSKLHRRRLLRPFMVGAGHVAAADSDPLSPGRVVDQAVQRVQQGFTAIVFPEGTRSPADGLRPFGRTAFEIACRARVPVVSLTIECRPLFLSKEVGMFDPPDPTAHLQLEVLAVDSAADCDFNSRALLRTVEARYQRWLAGSRLAGSSSRA